MDFVVLEDTRQEHWAEWREILRKSENLKLQHIQYTFFFSCITQCERVNTSGFLVEGAENGSKRQLGNGESSNDVKRFRSAPELVTLDSDEEVDSDDDIQILEQKIIDRKSVVSSRVYIEKSSKLNSEVIIELGDSSDEENAEAQTPRDEREAHHNSGLSLGLQKAISAIQQRPNPLSRKSESQETNKLLAARSNDLDDDKDDDDDITVLEEKSRKIRGLDKKSIMFQSGLRNLLNHQDLDTDDKSKSSLEEEEETKPVEEVEVASPPRPFPALSLEKWASKEGEEEEEEMRRLCRVVDCVLERQTQTGECLTVGLTVSSSRTLKYVRSRTRGGRGQPRPVDSSVREEFYQKYQERRGETEASLTSEINQICNVLSSLRFLQSYTSHLTQPTPAILHNLLSSCLRPHQSSLVVERILDYLELSLYRFLSCLSSGIITYRAWLEIILSACRTGPNIDYNSFNLDNKQDTAACLAFFRLLLTEFSSQQEGREGAALLAEFLLRLCQKDLQLWWRQHKSEGLPVLYYLLGDSTSSLVPTIKTLVSPVYRGLLEVPYSQKLGLVRRLISLCAILVSHLDEDNKQSYINGTASKHELAGVVATVLVHCRESLWSELVLLQPDWFSLLVSRQLFSLLTGRRSKLSSLADLSKALARLSVEEAGGGVGRCLDILHYRAISSCHLHTILRSVWQAGDNNKSGTVFTMMNRLDRTQEKTYQDKSRTKIVRFRSGVSFKLANMVEDINQLAGFVNGRERVASSVHNHLPSLLFKMTEPKSF